MSGSDLRRLEELRWLYPIDPCRQIARFALGALDSSSHADYLTVIPVDGGKLMEAAFAEADCLIDLRSLPGNRLEALKGDRAVLAESPDVH